MQKVPKEELLCALRSTKQSDSAVLSEGFPCAEPTCAIAPGRLARFAASFDQVFDPLAT